MKIDELKNALRKMIREEVKRAVTEEVNRAMGKVLVEMVKEIKSNDVTRIVESVEEPLQEVIHTKNAKFNSALMETARRGKPLQRTTDSTNLVELMDGGFDKIGGNQDVGIEQPASNMDFLKQMVGNSPMIPTQKSVLDSGVEIPDGLKNVFKKDFRAVMKKIDEQKNGGGGFINPSSLLG